MFASGTTVAGKYRIERVLGEGGMGVVLAATHVQLGSHVALKFLRPDMARHKSVVERFMREARASAQLRSENACRVSDVGMLDDGVPYIVMELLTGRDLSSLLKANGVMPPTVIAEYIMQACNAVAEAHALGIVHRDLKPGNLFVSQRPDGKSIVKVLDFGVATAPDSQKDFSLTQTSSVMGSPGYMSPEQLKSSKSADPRSDIWSLGVVMYELTSARQPFIAESITELALRVAMDPTPQLPASVPRGFGEVVARCLEKDPARRYQDVGALALALAPFAASGHEAALGISRVLRASTQASPGPSAEASTPTTLGSASGVVDGTRRRRPGLIAGVAIAAVALGVVAVVAFTGRDGKDGGAGQAAKQPEVHVPVVAPEAVPAPPPAVPEAVPAPPPAVPTTPAPTTTTTTTTTTAPTTTLTPTPTPTPEKKPSTSKKKKPTIEDVGESRK